MKRIVLALACMTIIWLSCMAQTSRSKNGQRIGEFAAASIQSSVQGPDDSISVAGVDIRIGMTKEALVEKLRLGGRYKLVQDSPANEEDLERIRENTDRQGNAGAIFFRDNRARLVNKFWWSTVDQGNDANSLATALYGVLSRLNGEGRTVAKIEIEDIREPNGNEKRIKVIFSKKLVLITSSQFKELGNKPIVSVIEVLSNRN